MTPLPMLATPFTSRSVPPDKIPTCLLNCKPSRTTGPTPCGTCDSLLRTNGHSSTTLGTPFTGNSQINPRPPTRLQVDVRSSPKYAHGDSWSGPCTLYKPRTRRKSTETSKIDLLKQNATNGSGDPLRGKYLEKLERLELDYDQKGSNHPSEYDRLKRQTIADMLHIFQGNH